MQGHKGDFNGRSCTIYPAKNLILSDESPPDFGDFVFRVYRGRLGDRKGKFFVGYCGPLFLTLQLNHLGESSRIQTVEGIIPANVIGCVGLTAREGPRVVFGVEDVALVRWTWKPDGFNPRNKVFVADARWLDPQTTYTPPEFQLKRVNATEPVGSRSWAQPNNQMEAVEEDNEWVEEADDYDDGIFIGEDGETYILDSDIHDVAPIEDFVQAEPETDPEPSIPKEKTSLTREQKEPKFEDGGDQEESYY